MAQYGKRNPKPTDPNGPQSPGAGAGPSYLSPEQQAKVDKLLGDKYNPNKALNVQLFQARWQAASPEEKRAMVKNLSSQFLEGGPKSKTFAGFHGEYLDALKEENRTREQQLQMKLEDYHQTQGGFTQSQAEFDANTAYWNTFAATPEGQAFIAGQGYTPEDWIASQQASMQEGLDNYNKQVQQFGNIQSLAQSLGQEVPGFVPPGWDSTLSAIQEGRAPLPGMSTLHNYSGVASTVEGIDPNLFDPSRHKETQNQQAAAPAGTGLYQPFTAFTGLQSPNSFSERDLYQETQAR